MPQKQMTFITSAAGPEGYPPADQMEVVVLGRSNSGKSSLINSVAGSDIARVSKRPGKTQLLNFFAYGSSYRWVDVPGYGYSSRSGHEQRSWQRLIEDYLVQRESLVGALILVDCRRPWHQDEDDLVDWLKQQRPGLPVVVAMTKCDQLSKNELSSKLKLCAERSGLKVLACSSRSGEGIDELEEFLFRSWIKESR